MNRSAKDGTRSSPQYGGEGVTHSPIVPRCLLAARYGRFMRDPRRPVCVPASNRVSDPISESEMGSSSLESLIVDISPLCDLAASTNAFDLAVDVRVFFIETFLRYRRGRVNIRARLAVAYRRRPRFG